MSRHPIARLSQHIPLKDFNERVKQLLKDKPDPRKAESRRKSIAPSAPRPVKQEG